LIQRASNRVSATGDEDEDRVIEAHHVARVAKRPMVAGAGW